MEITETRSRIMRAVKSKDTVPEMIVRRIAHDAGYRFRLHVPELPGKPDIVFPSRKKVIFVHGCFWHAHEGCRKFSIPKTRSEWWREKLLRNVQRDTASIKKLEAMGWSVLIIWECEISDPHGVGEVLDHFLQEQGKERLPSCSVDKQELDLSPSSALDDDPVSVPLEAEGFSMAKATTMRARTDKAAAKSVSSGKKGVGMKGGTKVSPPRTSRTAAKSAGAILWTDPLPERYSALAHPVSGTVDVSRDGRSITVQMKSLPSVTNVLAAMERAKSRTQSDLSTVKISFPSGKGLEIPIESFVDVAAAVSNFGAGNDTLIAAQHGAMFGPGRRGRHRMRISEDAIPSWFAKDFKDEYNIEQDGFRLKRSRLSMDASHLKGVLGRWNKKASISGWGYEILSGKKRVGWVIADAPDHFVISGVPNTPPSNHRGMVGVMARIATMIIPALRENLGGRA